MKIFSLMRAATLGHPERLRSMILWTLLEYAFRGAPYGVLLMGVWEFFKPLQNPGTSLNIPALIGISVALAVSLVLLFIVSKIAYKKTYNGTYEICAEGRLTISNHIRQLPMGFFNTRDPGTIGAYLLSDYANVEQLLSHLLPQLVGAVAMPSLLLVFLAFQNWQLALLSAAVIPLSLPILVIAIKFIKHFGKKQQKAKREATSRMLEYLHGMKLIKAFNLTGTKFERLEKTFRNFKSVCIKLEAGAGPIALFASFVLRSGLAVIILFGLTFLFAGTVSLPVYVMFLIIGSRVYEPFLQALIFVGEINYFQLSVDRIEDLRKTPVLKGTNPELKPENYNVQFDNVTFRYHDTNVLNNVTVTIPEASFVALVGPSGSGKTTMTRLIARFWDVSKGTVLLGDHDIRKYDPDVVLASVSMVFQDVYLFNDSIINNIRVGKTDATIDDVINSAKKARCHEFIQKLPKGYDTIIGEGGSTLSGGEKQRISIARAILKDAPIILLDEATASLDPENELHIQEAINDLVKHKTVIVIAHRLNTVVHADNIIVLENGSVVEQGTHQTLLNNKNLYYRMWNEQRKIHGWKF
ncbi:MAG: ABC transporter ATP-binding protein [archaeon]